MSKNVHCGPTVEYKGITPQAYSMHEVADIFGVSYMAVWSQVRAGTFPAPHLKIGRIYRFPKRAVHQLLGLEEEEAFDAA